VVQIAGRANQLRNFSRTEDHGKPLPLLRIGQILFHVAALQHFDVKESERANVLNYRVHRQLPVSEQVRMVAPEVIRPELIERFIDVSLEMLYRFGVRVDRCRGVVAPDQFLPHSLNECVHRELLSLRPHYSSNHHHARSAAAPAASLCAGHAQQLGGESPPPNLMEVKG
jgi:hypothetical protein